MTPEEALDACLDADFTEDQWYHDARSGRVRLDTLTAETVIFVSEQGTPLPLGDATDLLESYHNGSIQPTEETP